MNTSPATVITSDMVTPCKIDATRFAVDASELAWKPGYWPNKVQTTLGNGLDLIRDRSMGPDNGYAYKQTLGVVEVLVFND